MGLAGKASGLKIGVLIGLLLLFLLPVQPAKSDTVQYIYDNLGRLVMAVSSSGTVIVYEYDDAGRMVSTTRTTINNQLPVITGITPNQVFIGTETVFTITGRNLLETQTVTSDNSGIEIRGFTTTNNSVSLDAIISKNITTGPADFTIQTLNGSASMSVNLINLTFTPSQVAMLNGASESVTVRIDGLTSDYELSLTNQNPDIVQAPQSLTVPVAGSAPFIINSVSQGTGIIEGGNSGVSVFVTPSYSGNTFLYGKPVSIKFPSAPPLPVQSNAPAYALPVSIGNFVMPPLPVQSNAPAYALPVSIGNFVMPPLPVQSNAPAYALPVSIGNFDSAPAPVTSNAPFYAAPVSTAISNSGG